MKKKKELNLMGENYWHFGKHNCSGSQNPLTSKVNTHSWDNLHAISGGWWRGGTKVGHSS